MKAFKKAKPMPVPKHVREATLRKRLERRLEMLEEFGLKIKTVPPGNWGRK